MSGCCSRRLSHTPFGLRASTESTGKFASGRTSHACVFFYVSIIGIIGAPQSGPPRPPAALGFSLSTGRVPYVVYSTLQGGRREHHTRSIHKWTNVYEAHGPVPKIVLVRASVRPGVPVWAVLKDVAVGRTLLGVGARQTQASRSMTATAPACRKPIRYLGQVSRSCLASARECFLAPGGY